MVEYKDNVSIPAAIFTPEEHKMYIVDNQHVRDAFIYAQHAADTIKMGPGGQVGGPFKVKKMKYNKTELWACLATRLRVPAGSEIGLDFIDFHVGDAKVHVFVVKNDQATTIEDDANLFPSDSLIATLRLLIG